MHKLGIGESFLLLVVVVQACWAAGQSSAVGISNDPPYRLSVAVNEVVLNFRALDGNGLAIDDLTVEELELLDNGKPPRRIVAFDRLRNSPLRLGILMDASDSMQASLAESRAIAIRSTQAMLRQPLDQGFVMEFGRQSRLVQAWTGDPALMKAGVLRVVPAGSNPPGGTAIFDTILGACLYEFGRGDPEHGRAILLFSDGEDNASYTSLEEAVARCQSSDTAIYVFHIRNMSGRASTGPGNLATLAAKTGGRVFRNEESEGDIDADLRIVESDLRDRYRVVYQPAELKHDGSFHPVRLVGPDRVKRATFRSGYYAPLN
jgi:Ca-activated chloride channel family protein